MTSSLRMRVVKAGARAACETDDGSSCLADHVCASVVLDAMLDCLTENADEVRAEIYELWAVAPGEPSDMVADLVEVLREPTDG